MAYTITRSTQVTQKCMDISTALNIVTVNTNKEYITAPTYKHIQGGARKYKCIYEAF